MNDDILEIHPGIHQIVGRKRAAHVYLVRGRRKNVLIDCGLPTSASHIESCLATLGLRADDIDIVVLTHEHVDHAGGVPHFSRHAVIAAHRLAANKLVLKDEFALMNRAFDEAAGDADIDLLLDEGATIDLGNFELQVLHTPGHCSGAISIYEPNAGILFAGDTVMANGVLGGVLGSGNVSDYIHSLKRLSCLRIERLFPGHGYLSDSAAADIAKGIESLQDLLGDAKTLFDALKHSRYNFDPILRSLRDLNIR